VPSTILEFSLVLTTRSQAVHMK